MPTVLARRSFADFTPGTAVRTRARTVTEADIAAFAGLSWDFHPLHTDEEYARGTAFGTRIAHGPLVYAMSIGIMPIDFFGDAIVAFLGVEELRHRLPVFAGDTIDVSATVSAATPTSKGDSGVVKIRYVTANQREEVVMEMTVTFLMRRQDAPPES
jgi:3-hydroxybutyryl-CoA dehydratase